MEITKEKLAQAIAREFGGGALGNSPDARAERMWRTLGGPSGTDELLAAALREFSTPREVSAWRKLAQALSEGKPLPAAWQRNRPAVPDPATLHRFLHERHVTMQVSGHMSTGAPRTLQGDEVGVLAEQWLREAPCGGE